MAARLESILSSLARGFFRLGATVAAWSAFYLAVFGSGR